MKGLLEVGYFTPELDKSSNLLSLQWKSYLRDQGFYVDSPLAGLTVCDPFDIWSAYRESQAIFDKTYRSKPAGHKTRVWHKDNINEKSAAGTIIMWANIKSTQLRPNRNSKDVLDFPDGLVVAFDNRKFEHRRPDMALEEARQRYFCRAIFPRYTTKELI